MNPSLRLTAAFILIITLSAAASAATPPAVWIDSMKKAAYAIGWFIMVVLGARWIIAENASDRGDAKKGMIYVVIALVIIAGICNVMCIYCEAAIKAMAGNVDSAGNPAPIAFNCDMGNIGCPAC
jgi:hypothetical protein